MRSFGSAAELGRRRERAIQMLQEGLPPFEVARKLGVDRRSVRRWRAAFGKHGTRGLQPQPVPGRPVKLDLKAQHRLERLLLKGAQAAGFPTDLWTCPRVRDLIESRFRVRYHEDHVGRLLQGLGWSCQKPQRRAVERDEERIQRWIKEEWPRIKKKPRA